MRKHIFFLSLLVLAVFFAYRGLPNSYFEQDEWHTFARFLEVKNQGTKEFFNAAFLSGPLTHFTPLSFLTKYTFFNFFSLNATGYFVASLLMHTIAAGLLYAYLFRLSKNYLGSFLGALFFAANSSHIQSVSWLGAFESTQGAVIFGLLFLIFFEKRFYLSLVFLSLSLLFKETAFSFWLFGLFLSLAKKERLKGMALVFLVYLFFKFSYLFLGGSAYSPSVGAGEISFFKAVFYNVTTLPLKASSLSLFPRQLFIDLSGFLPTSSLASMSIPNPIWKSYQFLSFDLLSASSGIILWFTLRKFFKENFFRLGATMFLASIAPLLILNKPLVFFDSRFFYLITISTAIFILGIFEKIKGKQKFVFLALFLGLIFIHFNYVSREIDRLVGIGNLRRDIIAETLKIKPRLFPQTVFYTESDTKYYGLDEAILPFQSGFGQTLLVNYVAGGEIPASFFNGDFLWEIDSQGYKEIEDRGFGYFRDPERLKKTLIEYNIPRESIVAFSWSGLTGEIKETTEETRKEIFK